MSNNDSNAIALDVNYDIGIDANGQIIQVIDNDQIAQNVEQRLRSFKGEFFLDREHGVPWFQSIFVAPANPPLSESIIKKTILETHGVVRLLDFNINFNRVNRIASFTDFRILTIHGIIDRHIED